MHADAGIALSLFRAQLLELTFDVCFIGAGGVYWWISGVDAGIAFPPIQQANILVSPEHRLCISTLTNLAADYGAQGPLRENGFDLFTKTKKDLDNSTCACGASNKRISAHIVACHMS